VVVQPEQCREEVWSASWYGFAGKGFAISETDIKEE